MIKYRDYAIITVDDDIYYSSDTILSLYESYINHPNVISGRRTHILQYKSNLLINKYSTWLYEQTFIKNSSYDLFITTGAGALYPPDILNIDEKYMDLIKEIITTDDIALKHYEINKGIESIWVPNNLMLGYKIKANGSKVKDIPLYYSNTVFINDKNINKVNININNIVITNYCIQYKNIKTGLLIYLFNINNIKFDKQNTTNFEIDAYSFCPIDEKIKFKILFNESVIAKCNFFNDFSLISKNLKIFKTKTILRASCSIKNKINKLDDFFFPIAQSNNGLFIDILNKRNYISLIFKDFYCINSFKCTMVALSYKNLKKGYKINIHIYDNDYLCKLRNEINYLNNNIPIISNFSCVKKFNNSLNNNDYIGGIKFASYIKNINLNNNIPNQFIINKIYIEKLEKKSLILIKGRLLDSLEKNIKNLTIYVTYPEINLECILKHSSKYIQANIYCFTKYKFTGEILIENQIIYNQDFSESLILINELTLIQNYEILDYVEIKECTFIEVFIKIINNLNQKIYYIILFLLLLLKLQRHLKKII